jgi:2-isopropylmalate synthase
VLETEHGFDLPRALQVAFSAVIQRRTEASGGEITPDEIRDAFEETYVRPQRFRLLAYRTTNDPARARSCTVDATIADGDRHVAVRGRGTGPIDAFVDGLRRALQIEIHVHAYHEHAMRSGEDSAAVAYIQLATDGDASTWGAGIDADIVTASLTAIVAAAGRAYPTTITEETISEPVAV